MFASKGKSKKENAKSSFHLLRSKSKYYLCVRDVNVCYFCSRRNVRFLQRSKFWIVTLLFYSIFSSSSSYRWKAVWMCEYIVAFAIENHLTPYGFIANHCETYISFSIFHLVSLFILVVILFNDIPFNFISIYFIFILHWFVSLCIFLFHLFFKYLLFANSKIK